MATVSVLMSVYGEPLDWIQTTVESILNQTYADFEFIIINDKPDRKELSDFLNDLSQRDGRIKIHTNKQNIGLTKSLNVGLKLCTGKYIARMDADDIAFPSRLEKQVHYMDQHPEVIVCGTDVELFGAKNFLSYTSLFEDDVDIRGQMLCNSGLAHPTVIIRRSTLVDNNIQYDETYRSAQDYRLWEQLCKFGKFHNLPEKLLRYRLSEQQVTKKLGSDQTNNRDQINARFAAMNNAGELISVPEDVDSATKIRKKIESYSLRADFYKDFSIKSLAKFLVNNKTKCSGREITFMVIYALYRKIRRR